MTVRPDLCYRAVRSRDARFDGRFYTGVVTTGVYCRPICPARTPRFENVRFFPCAAAAEAAGFRPCRRCRPETAPGTPAWTGTSAAASRALRLVADGALDHAGVAELAARVGIGDRHLRRLFLAHFGATPHAVAHTRRVHFARRLIDETTLPMAEIAHAADFPSIRRFNAAIRDAFGRTPTALRRESPNARPASPDAPITLRLSCRPPFAWDAILRYLAPRATPGIEEVTAGEYRRTIAVGGSRGTIAVTRSRGAHGVQLTVRLSDTTDLGRVVERVRRMFDLGADPREIASHLSADPLLRSRLRALSGVRVPGAWDGFELAVRAVLGQQVSVAGATTMAGRLAREFGAPLGRTDTGTGLSLLFPTPSTLADADLAKIGLTRARAEAITEMAREVRDGRLVLDPAGDPDQAVAGLLKIAGIGPWTAQYIAMRALGEPDAFPDGDLGLQREAGGDGRPISAGELRRRSEGWRPWRAYAAMLLWMQIEGHHEHH